LKEKGKKRKDAEKIEVKNGTVTKYMREQR
jgi:hypothetical protein